jgi:hypothetical protein
MFAKSFAGVTLTVEFLWGRWAWVAAKTDVW